MNIKRFINRNGKLIWYIALIIVFVFFIISYFNSYYEKEENVKKVQMSENDNFSKVTENNSNYNSETVIMTYSTDCKTSLKAIKSFIYYCNNKDIENAYKMLTEECKNAMFPSVEEFEKIYINNIFNIQRTYELEKWSTEENKNTYLISLYGSILETGKLDEYTQDYYTLIKNDEGIYRLNINNFIYAEKKNVEISTNGVAVKIENVDIYDEYEKVTITITNNTSKQICLTGNKSNENIYLLDANNITYLSLNSIFDREDLVLEPKTTQTFTVQFNKIYNATNKANTLVLSDVILDYEEYLNSDNKESYSNRTSIKVGY